MILLPLVFVALYGLAFGSFLNVCISRLPQHESVVTPRSRCPHCRASLRAWDNIPLLSWILLRGRCRACRTAIPLRYPLVEAATSALWIACYMSFGWTISFAGAAIFCFLLLGLAVMDAETMRLPNSFTLPGIALGIGFAGLDPQSWVASTAPFARLRAAAISLTAALLAAGLILLIRWLYQAVRGREGIGLGDAKLLAMIAAWLGIERTLLTFLLAVAGAAFFGVAVSLARHPSRDAKTLLEERLPLGAFLAVAAIYARFLGWSTVRWYLGLF